LSLYILVGLPTLGTASMRWACRFRHVQFPMNCRFSELAIEGLPVDEARNAIAAAAVRNPEVSHVWFLDDDVLVHAHALLQLLAGRKDVIGGVYFTKGAFGQPVVFEHPNAGPMEYMAGTGLHPVYAIGMGLTLIRTEVFRRLQAELDLGVDDHGNPQWFRTCDRPGDIERLTEDTYFCRMCDRVGIERWVDTNPYSFGWHWDKTTGQAWPQPQWSQWESGRSVEWPLSDQAAARAQTLRMTRG
jgi:hypothetical protein